MNPVWAQWLPRQRWYAGHDRTLASVLPYAVLPLRDGLEVTLLDLAYTDGATARYQVVVPSGSEPDAARQLLSLIDSDAVIGDIRFSKEPGAVLPTGAAASLIDAEQSNTSVVFGQQAVFKLFRQLTCGVNPDIELNRMLGAAGNRHVARLLGSFEMLDHGKPYPLGMVSEYVPDAVNGW